jgi:hypothetical protein
MSMSEADPAKNDPRRSLLARGRQALQGGGRLIGLLILGILSLIVINAVFAPGGYLSFDPTALVAMALVGAGVLLLRGQDPPEAAAGPKASARPPSPLGLATLSAVFLMTGLLILLGNLGVTEFGLGQIAAGALLLVGIGLLVGVWWGRSRLLIVVGLLLIPLVLLGALVDFPLRGSVGDRYVYVASVEDIRPSYELLLGALTVDLVEVKDWTTTESIDFRVAGGRVTIYIPEDISVSVRGEMEWGNATVGRGREEGEDLVFSHDLPGESGAGHLDIDFKGGIASLYIERISEEERFGPPPEPEEQQQEKKDGRKNRRKKGRRARDKA